MAQPLEREKPTLGQTALQIIEDVPTVLMAGNTTLYLNRTFAAQVEDVSLKLQRQRRQPYYIPRGRTEDIYLPSTTPRFGSDYCGHSPRTNTAIQEVLARATGVLEPEESFVDFLNRTNVVATTDWREFHKIEDEQPDKIPGMQYVLPTKSGNAVQYAGQPFILTTSTKYLGVRAAVEFKTVGNSQIPLDELVEKGLTTMHITLRVPKSEFLTTAA